MQDSISFSECCSYWSFPLFFQLEWNGLSWGSLLGFWGQIVTANQNKFFFQHWFLKSRYSLLHAEKVICYLRQTLVTSFCSQGLGRSLSQWNLLQVCCWLCCEQKQTFLNSMGNKSTRCHVPYCTKRWAKRQLEGPPSSFPLCSNARSGQVKDPVPAPAVPSLSVLICRANHAGFPLHAALFL